MIRYSSEALDDIDRLFAWLNVRDARSAARFVAALRRTTGRISSRPLMYPIVRDEAVRKCLMRFGGAVYVLYYVVEDSDQTVLRVWHGREQRA